MTIKIDPQAIKRQLHELGKFGRDEDGSISRMAYSDVYYAGREWLREDIEKSGLHTNVDTVGNLIITLEGRNKGKTILLGSHIDTVPNGGMFDGCYGVISGVECLRAMYSAGYVPNHTIQVVAFIDEEGNAVTGCFGSKCFTGKKLDKYVLNRAAEVGVTEADVRAAKNDLKKFLCYIEIHIEQGGVLDSIQIPVGIVQGIVGIRRYFVTVEGKANHAGTTPMELRDDALVRAAAFISEVDRAAREVGGGAVATIGKLEVSPGACNVIPSRASMLLEIRAIKDELMNWIIDRLSAFANGQPITFEQFYDEPVTWMDERIRDMFRRACRSRAVEYHDMPSGAGHDGCSFASQGIPCGMLFVPSIGGISHAKEELTAWKDLKIGTQVLLDTILLLDRDGL